MISCRPIDINTLCSCVFQSMQVAREEWSGALWANLNTEQLTEEFMRQLRKLPKEVKALPICHVLEERMREFKDSVPLFLTSRMMPSGTGGWMVYTYVHCIL